MKAGFSETTFYSPNQHDLQIQIYVFHVIHEYVAFLCCVLWSVEAIIVVRYSWFYMVMHDL